MVRYFIILISFFLIFLSPLKIFAEENNFVNIVNPIRGSDFWEFKDQRPIDAILGQKEILNKHQLPATWLIRFDALTDRQIVDSIKSNPSDEVGLFLEITPSLTSKAGVNYHKTDSWHLAGSIFLTGYSQSDRLKLIDTSFEGFKDIFGNFPKSVGAWWIDSYSLDYMQKKYGVTGALIVADQYSTDNYQIWGQYWSTPYYPAKRNTLNPAQSAEDKIPVVITQWAARDPYHAYSNGVNESTYSVQANDYTDFHNLSTDYFSKLIDIYTDQPLNKFGEVVVGLENSYQWDKYKSEYEKQVAVIKDRSVTRGVKVVTLSEFSIWYKERFPGISPEHIIVAKDPLGTEKRVVWFMNPFYRVGWFYNGEYTALRDIRQYVAGQEELCFTKICESINFAFFATRVLDDVTYGEKWITGIGKVNNLEVVAAEDNTYKLTYTNEAGREKKVEFLPRDLSINNQKMTIDLAISKGAESEEKAVISSVKNGNDTKMHIALVEVLKSSLLFALFTVLVLIFPGYIFTRNLFLATSLGVVLVTLYVYIFSFFTSNTVVMLTIYAVIATTFAVYSKVYKDVYNDLRSVISKMDIPLYLLLLLGIIFQSYTVFKSGLLYKYGVGYWGPTGHDGIWHEALINQLIKNPSPLNPILAGEQLNNYHYFYDLFIAAVFTLTRIPVSDLIYRIIPVGLSLLLGIGTYLLSKRLFESKAAAMFSVYLVYFTGSFGWIVEYFRSKTLGGESVFWANQAISFNFNPPFALSLIILISIIIFLSEGAINTKKGFIALVILIGTLVEYKAYAGVLVIAALGLVSLKIFIDRDTKYIKLFSSSLALSLLVFLPNNSNSSSLIQLSPFWFIHSMIDSPDRVGWLKLSQARSTYLAEGNYLKFISVELLSLIIFVVGNLGVRIFAIFSPLIVRFRDKSVITFILAIVLMGIMIPILLIQKGNPWNTIQFIYYSLFLAAILSGGILAQMLRFKPRWFWTMLLLVLLIITPVNSLVSFKDFMGNTPPTAVSKGEFEALQFLRNQPQGVVLSYQYHGDPKVKVKEPVPIFAYVSSAYVSAISNQPSYIADIPQHEILQTDFQKRLVGADEFFNWQNDQWSKEFLMNNKIRYIYLPKVFNIKLNIDTLGLVSVYENDEVEVFLSK